MIDTVLEDLVLEFLEWLLTKARTYEEVMEAWRTSCPKLPVWKDANDRGLVEAVHVNGRRVIEITALGRKHLEVHRLSKTNRRDQERKARCDA
jgi:D-3-phosphoglycerate dehydrogenase